MLPVQCDSTDSAMPANGGRSKSTDQSSLGHMFYRQRCPHYRCGGETIGGAGCSCTRRDYLLHCAFDVFSLFFRPSFRSIYRLFLSLSLTELLLHYVYIVSYGADAVVSLKRLPSTFELARVCKYIRSPPREHGNSHFFIRISVRLT